MQSLTLGVIHVFSMQQNNARVIADSILGLHREDLISNPLDDPHVTTELQEEGASLLEGQRGTREPYKMNRTVNRHVFIKIL